MCMSRHSEASSPLNLWRCFREAKPDLGAGFGQNGNAGALCLILFFRTMRFQHGCEMIQHGNRFGISVFGCGGQFRIM